MHDEEHSRYYLHMIVLIMQAFLTLPVKVASSLLSRSQWLQFHEEIISICSFLSETDHLEIDELYKLPIFVRTMSFVEGVYQKCTFEPFKSLLEQLRDRAADETPVAVVITKSPEIIAVICIPIAHPDFPHAYIVFDSHARPTLHPNGSAFLFFPTPDQAAEYLAELLRVDDSLLNQTDLQWQSEMLTTFSGHIFSSLEASSTTAITVKGQLPEPSTPWSMLYETSVDLVQVRGRLTHMEQEIIDLRRENERLRLRTNALKSDLEAQRSASSHQTHHHQRHDHHSNDPFDQSQQEDGETMQNSNAIEMTDEQYAKFWGSGGRPNDSSLPLSSGQDQSTVYLAGLSNQLELAAPQQDIGTHRDKGKGRAIGERPSWAIGESASHMNSTPTRDMNRSQSGRATKRQPAVPGSMFDHQSQQFGEVSNGIADHNKESEARRLQTLEAQDVKSRELALQLDREERRAAKRATTIHSFEPPSMFDRNGGESSSSLPSVMSIAGSVVGFVGNHLSPFGKSTADPPSPTPASKSFAAAVRRSTSNNNGHPKSLLSNGPAPDVSSDYLKQLKRQVEEQQEAKSLELALRLQREEELATSNQQSYASATRLGPTLPPRPPLGNQSNERTQRADPPPRPLSSSRNGLRAEPGIAASSPRTLARGEEDRQVALRIQLEEQSRQKALELTQQLQEEERATAELIASLANQEQFECGVCMDEKLIEDVAMIPGCDHRYCRDCLRDYLGAELNNGAFPIMCPDCKAEKAKEPATVPSSLAEHLGLTDKQYDQWSKLDLQRYSLVIDCPHCQQSSLVDRDDYAASAIVTCPLPHCRGQWCKDCNQRVDPTVGPHSCDGEKEMDVYIRQQNIIRCPGCKTPTEKTMGCNHMTCGAPGCNTHFCYIDGLKIITSQVGPEIQAAIQRHYAGCKLFDYQ